MSSSWVGQVRGLQPTVGGCVVLKHACLRIVETCLEASHYEQTAENEGGRMVPGFGKRPDLPPGVTYRVIGLNLCTWRTITFEPTNDVDFVVEFSDRHFAARRRHGSQFAPATHRRTGSA